MRADEVDRSQTGARSCPRRILYLVGPDGKVLKAYPDVNPSKHAAEVLADIEKIHPSSR